MTRQAFFDILLLVTCVYAFWRGGAPERIASLTLFGGDILTVLAATEFADRFRHLEVRILLVDLLVFGSLVGIALRTTRWWPLLLAGLQLDAVAVHAMRLAVPASLPATYMTAIALWAYLYAARTLGATGLPASATALLTFGGNAALKPERATTWTGTVSLHPRAIEGARVEVSYFHINYRDRVTQPIQGTNFFTALAGSAYQDFIQPSPSAQLQADTVNASAAGFFNFAGTAYVPANVVALVSDTYLNAARQRIEGIDVAADYRIDIASGDTLALTASGSWLRSNERLSPSLPRTQLAGTIFNPPHFKGRFGATWLSGALSIAAFANYVGGLADTRSQPRVRVGSQTTADLAIVYRSAAIGSVRNLDLSLSVRNLLDDKPPYARPVANYYVNYDSTNHSAIGRFVSFAITKHW